MPLARGKGVLYDGSLSFLVLGSNQTIVALDHLATSPPY